MGCCASRPRDENGGDTHAGQHHAVQDMIAASQLPHPPPIFRENSNRPASSSNSVATSAVHEPVALNQHYNEPLRTHVWRTKAGKRPWTFSKWKRMREEFFHTRVTNRPEIWSSLKTVVELLDQGEVETAQGILDASEITLPTGDLADGAYDGFGNLYQMPPFAVSAPENMTEDSEAKPSGRTEKSAATGAEKSTDADQTAADKEKTKDKDGGEKKVELFPVKARLSDRGSDVVVKIGAHDPTRILITLIAEKAGLPANKVKIAYMGKIMKPNKGFVAQGWQPGHVVNAMVMP